MLEIGDKAPDFSGVDAEGNTLRLSDFKGRKLVLYFYPKDNTSGCTAEACDLRDNYERFLAQGYSIVGVSRTVRIPTGNLLRNIPCPSR